MILINKYGVRADKVFVIPLGVNTRKFYPMERIKKIPDSLLFVGRLDKRKGADFLVRTMPLVVREVPDVKLFLGGTGRNLPKLEAYVAKHGLERNVEFLGFIPENKLNEWYNKVKCVVVPSMFEGFGLTVIEAMAVGTSIIATNVDSLKDIVEDHVNGFLVDYNDVWCLSDRIVLLLKEGKMRDEFIAKGRDLVRRVFNWDVAMKSNLEQLYGPIKNIRQG